MTLMRISTTTAAPSKGDDTMPPPAAIPLFPVVHCCCCCCCTPRAGGLSNFTHAEKNPKEGGAVAKVMAVEVKAAVVKAEEAMPVPPLASLPLSSLAAELTSSARTPRACQHTPRLSSTFEACGCLGDEFEEYRSQVYWNPRAASRAGDSAGGHIPAAYAYCRGFLAADEVFALKNYFQEACGPEGASCGFRLTKGLGISTMRCTLEPLEERFPTFVARIAALKDAFGHRCELDSTELTAIAIGPNVTFTRHTAGGEGSPWTRDDDGQHFSVSVQLSEPARDFEGGLACLHCGVCSEDKDASARTSLGPSSPRLCTRPLSLLRTLNAADAQRR